MPGTSDPAAPSVKSLEIVRSKNNVAELELRRTLEQYDREKSVSIMNLDHERLDTKDFLKHIKTCSTDDLPESRIWLGDRTPGRKGDSVSRRNIFTAPPGGCRTRPDEATPEEEAASSEEPEEEPKDDLQRRLKIASQITLSIFNRRSMYSTLERKVERPVWPSMENKMDESGQPIKEVKFKDSAPGRSSPSGVQGRQTPTLASRAGTPSVILRTGTPNTAPLKSGTPSTRQNTPSGKSAGESKDKIERPSRRSGLREAMSIAKGGDFMKELLVKNAKKRYKKTKDPPLEDRITDFFSKIDTRHSIMELSAEEKKRQWLLLTKGAKSVIVGEKVNDKRDDDGKT